MPRAAQMQAMAAVETAEEGLPPFCISLFGGAVEKRYRALKPAFAALDPSALDPADFEPDELARGRELWSRAAFNETRSAAAAAATARAFIAAQAPLDLSAMASSFVLDELAHAEACARIAAALGGAVELVTPIEQLDVRGPEDGHALMVAAVLAVRHYCVEETSSAPLLRATAQAARHPLLAHIFSLLAKDEAMHSQLGWLFLDWCVDQLSETECVRLGRVAQATLDAWSASWPTGDDEQHLPLGGLPPRRYRELAEVAAADIVASLASYGISVEVPRASD